MGTSSRGKIARSPHRALIVRMLALGKPSLREIGARFQIDASNLCRYRKAMSPEEVASAIMDGAGGLSRDELFALCRAEHDAIPVSIASRQQRLEHVQMLAMSSQNWPAVVAIDARLHALDQFKHELYAPVMDGLSAAAARTPKIGRIVRVILDHHGDEYPPEISTVDGEVSEPQDIEASAPDEAGSPLALPAQDIASESPAPEPPPEPARPSRDLNDWTPPADSPAPASFAPTPTNVAYFQRDAFKTRR